MSSAGGLRARRQGDGVAISKFPYQPLKKDDDDEDKDLKTSFKELVSDPRFIVFALFFIAIIAFVLYAKAYKKALKG
eukprot:Nk52_evm39s208 gene=Nk52_evmTU39s208